MIIDNLRSDSRCFLEKFHFEKKNSFKWFIDRPYWNQFCFGTQNQGECKYSAIFFRSFNKQLCAWVVGTFEWKSLLWKSVENVVCVQKKEIALKMTAFFANAHFSYENTQFFHVRIINTSLVHISSDPMNHLICSIFTCFIFHVVFVPFLFCSSRNEN